MISEIKSLSEAREQSMNIIKSKELTYEQKTSQLAKLAENLNLYPSNSTNEKLFEISQNGGFCDLWEGHAPYAPRYICPDYQKLLDEGCAFLRLEKSETLLDAIHNLLIFYHHVPSVTNQIVYLYQRYFRGLAHRIGLLLMAKRIVITSAVCCDFYLFWWQVCLLPQ